MTLRSFTTLILWSVNDFLRQPARTILSASALALLTFFIATVLLLFQALEDTAHHLLAKSPAVVIRRINAGGWAPIPVKPAMAAIKKIPGVIDPQPRIWGIASSRFGVFTILALDESIKEYLAKEHLPIPLSGQAVVGAKTDLGGVNSEKSITLASARRRTLSVIATLSKDSDMTTHDLVLTTAEDARFILAVPQACASDLTFNVFHQDEANALKSELATAFPWPVHITLREETQKRFAAVFASKGGLGLIFIIPAIIALVLLTLAGGNDLLARRFEVGLLRSLGWTNSDLACMQLLRSAIICLPSVLFGLSLAYLAVFAPAIQWIGPLLLGWSESVPAYYLSSSSAGMIIVEVFVFITAPYILASLWPVLVLAAEDPLTLLKGD